MSAPGQTPADAGRAVGSTRERGGRLRQSRPEGKVAPRGTSPRREGWCGFDCGGVSHPLVVLSPTSAQDSRPQMRDELSRARARWNRRPQMRASCPARAANGAPKGERPGGQRWAGWFFFRNARLLGSSCGARTAIGLKDRSRLFAAPRINTRDHDSPSAAEGHWQSA